MTKHTPGPWYIRRDYMTSPPKVCAEDRMLVMTTDRLSSELEANARLIAAAPDLLEAVQDLVELRDHPSRYSVGDANKRYERARAAIAKAEAAP